MVKLVVLLSVIWQCLVIGSVAKPAKVIVEMDDQSFNTTQLIGTVKELSKEPAKFRRIATIGLLMGAIRSEEQMEKELIRMTHDLLDNFNTSSMAEKETKLKEISKLVQRDLRAMFILSSAIDLTQYNASVAEFRNAMKEFAQQGELLAPKLDKLILKNGKSPVDTIRNFVTEHIRILRNTLMDRVSVSVASLQEETHKKRSLASQPIVVYSTENIEANTIPMKGDETMNGKMEKKNKGTEKKRKKSGMVHSGDADEGVSAGLNPIYYIPYQEEILNHFKELERDRRGSEGDDSEEFVPNDDEGPGGLVGLIMNLSGGGEGSDIGAVIGALTGVVARLLGPGGLDINSVLSSGTGLLAGLLGGDQNFGTVLASYVATSLDGFSGGGGADNNGLFLGNLVGGVIAALSGDPEDEDENPIKPGIFLKNLLMGTFRASSKTASVESDDRIDAKDRKYETGRKSQRMKRMEEDGDGSREGKGGSDVFGFITGLIGAVIGGVKSIIVNSLAGLSSGASKGSMDLAMKATAPLSHGSDSLAGALTT